MAKGSQAPFSVADLKERSRVLRESLLATHTATETEIAAYWPGGEENDFPPGRAAWTWCWAQLVRLNGRRESKTSEGSDERLDAVLAAALANEPELVRFDDGETRGVFPKSYHALRWLDSLERQMGVVYADAAYPIDVGADHGAQYAVAALAPLAESLCVRLWAWTITHPQADLPFPDDGEGPETPAFTRTMSAGDVVRLRAAHHRVNRERNVMIAAAFPPEPDEHGVSRLSLAGFLGTIEAEGGVRPYQLLRRWSLGEIMARAVSRAQHAREALAHAEAQRARTPGAH